MSQPERRAAAGVAAGLTALLLAAPAPTAALADLADAASNSDPTGPLVAVVALAAWAVTAWLGLAVAVVLASRLPGLVGRCSAAVARRVTPVAVRRTVEAALGLTVAVGALAPSTALATTVDAVSPTADAAWDLDWPRSDTPPPVPARPTAAPSPSLAPPTEPPPAVAPSAAPVAPTSVPDPAPTSVPAPDVRSSPAAPATGAVVVVRPGDSLWSLAEQSLIRSGTARPPDRQVAQAWPQWWAANRAVIGDDPDLLLPGTVLRPPPAGGS